MLHSCGILWEAIADKIFFQGNAFAHEVGEFFLELGSPDIGVFFDELGEDESAEGDVIGFVAQGVLKHLADSGHFVLSVQRQNHREEGVELRSLHDLGDSEDGLSELLFVFGDSEVYPHFEGGDVTGDKRILRFD